MAAVHRGQQLPAFLRRLLQIGVEGDNAAAAAPAQASHARHVLAAVGATLAEEGVSIASMIQKDSIEEGTAELVFTTPPALDAGLQRARARIAELDQIKRVCAFLRVF